MSSSVMTVIIGSRHGGGDVAGDGDARRLQWLIAEALGSRLHAFTSGALVWTMAWISLTSSVRWV